MKLERYRIQNFRCMYDSEWITMRKPLVLIGCNDGGKTATIHALDHLFSNTFPAVDDYSYVPNVPPDSEGNRPREAEIILEAIFLLNKVEKESLAENHFLADLETIKVRRKFQQEDNAQSFEIEMRVPEDPELPTDPTKLTIQEIRELISRYDVPSPGGARREPLLEALIKWLRDQPLKDGWPQIPKEIRDMLPLYQIVEGKDPENVIFQMLNVAYRQLVNLPETTALLAKFQDNINSLLKQPLEEKTSKLIEYISKYLPDIKQASVTPEYSVRTGIQAAPLTLVGSDGYRINLSGRGAGTKQQVTLAVFEWSSEILQPADQKRSDTILAFDEPDLHLDYLAQKRIYEAIESYLDKDIQVIVSTHSINFINRVPIDSICHYVKPASELKATIEYLTPSVEDQEEHAFFINRLGESMGIDNATMFYERCFLAFEGPTEQIALPILFRHYSGDSLFRRGIRLVNCYNAYGAIVFAKFLHRNNRAIIFLVDGDTTRNKGTKRHLTKEALEKAGFSIPSQVHFVTPEYFEFAFSDDIWARILNKYQPNSKNDWTPSRISSLRTTPSQFINRIYEILQEDSKPQIGLMLAQNIENKCEIPADIRKCFDHAVDMANR